MTGIYVTSDRTATHWGPSIILENPAIDAYISRMMERAITRTVEQALDYEAAVVLIGPRQVGKTTLAMDIGQSRDALYLDLENPADRSKLDDPVPFLESVANRLVILDEVHRTPDIFPILRGVIDRGRRHGKGVGRFLLLGSAALDISQQSGESLAGRVAYITMTPLLATEIEKDALNQLWVRGGFPNPFLASTEQASFQMRESMIRTYLEREIPLFGPRVPLEAMERLWTMLAHLHGGILNTSGLAQAMEISARSIGRYIDVLVDLMLVRRLRPYHANVGKRLVKSPKLYIRDSGLLHALLDVPDLPNLLARPVIGMSWEGFVIENILSVLPWRSHGYFYRTHTGAEIDLLIAHGDLSLTAIEIKRSIVRPRPGFHIARADLKPARSFVVHKGTDRFPLADGVEAISLPDLMKELANR